MTLGTRLASTREEFKATGVDATGCTDVIQAALLELSPDTVVAAISRLREQVR